MAPETKTSKRKAVVPADEVAKVKKVKALAAEVLPKKRKASGNASTEAAQFAKASKASATDSPKSSSKKSKAPAKDAEEVLTKKPRSSKDVSKAEKKLKAIAQDEEEEVEAEIETTMDDPEAVEIVDDQTEALLRGFASDDDDENAAQGPDREAGGPIPELDKKTKKKMRKLQEAAAAQAVSDGPGVIYLGRIPHGFYENEMKQYFKQFGDIKNIRLSRNPKTGASKHYAFIEFDSFDVAEIVAKTMDNYLMFGHILKCKIVPTESVHNELFNGANRRFKKVPWNRMEGRKLAAPAGESAWEKKIETENKRREAKKQKLIAQGIVYDFHTPALKSAKDVPKHDRSVAIEPAAEEETLTIESPTEVVAVVSETVTKGKGKNAKKVTKTKTIADEKVVEESTIVDAPVTIQVEVSSTTETGSAPPTKKGKKTTKKASATPAEIAEVVAEVGETPVEAENEAPSRRTRGAKRASATAAEITEVAAAIATDDGQPKKKARKAKGKA